jgi:hypothetical protein
LLFTENTQYSSTPLDFLTRLELVSKTLLVIFFIKENMFNIQKSMITMQPIWQLPSPISYAPRVTVLIKVFIQNDNPRLKLIIPISNPSKDIDVFPEDLVLGIRETHYYICVNLSCYVQSCTQQRNGTSDDFKANISWEFD